MKLRLAGRVDAALTAEPATTAAVIAGRQGGRDIRRAIDLQAAWGEMTGAAPVLPQAGLAITGDFLREHGDIVLALLVGIKASTAEVLADPAVAASHATGALGMPAPLLAVAIPHSNLVAHRATEARADIERMLATMTAPTWPRSTANCPMTDFISERAGRGCHPGPASLKVPAKTVRPSPPITTR